MSDKITWQQLMTLVSAGGSEMLVDFIRKARKKHGAQWLAEIKEEFPTFSWIADLACNKTGEEAFAELQREFPNYPLGLAKKRLLGLHQTLKFEIERKR